jgi:hypothetical protein
MAALPPAPLNALQQAVEELYLTFGRYPLSSLEGCPCCVSAVDQGKVTHRALRALTEDDLGRYAGKAMTTWGTVDDFKHFLPRLLELTGAFRAPYAAYVVLNKLEYGRWRTWHLAEIAAVERYLLALWDVVLVSEAGHFHGYFEALAGIHPRFEALLARWEASTDPKAWALLGEEVYYYQQALLQDKYFHGFLVSLPLSQCFRRWVSSQPVRDKLLAAFSQCSGEEAERLGIAYDVLDYDVKYRR